MKVLIACLTLAAAGLCQEVPTRAPIIIKNASDLIGKRVLLIDRVPLCKLATFESDITRGGTQADVVSAKPYQLMKLSAAQLSRMPAATRDLMIDQYAAAILTLRFDDGVKLDTCGVPYGPKKLVDFFQLASGEQLVAESSIEKVHAASGNSIQHLSDDEVKAALAGNGREYWTQITDQNFWSYGGARVQNITLYRPEAVIAQRQASAKKQFLKEYEPLPEDRERALIIEAEGQVGQNIGDGCDNLTRVILLSDEQGTVTREAYSTDSDVSQWGNALGASTQCQGVIAKFSADDVKAVRLAAKDGEFLIATFAGSTKTKVYKIKHKFQSKLNLDQMLMAKN